MVPLTSLTEEYREDIVDGVPVNTLIKVTSTHDVIDIFVVDNKLITYVNLRDDTPESKILHLVSSSNYVSQGHFSQLLSLTPKSTPSPKITLVENGTFLGVEPDTLDVGVNDPFFSFFSRISSRITIGSTELITTKGTPTVGTYYVDPLYGYIQFHSGESGSIISDYQYYYGTELKDIEEASVEFHSPSSDSLNLLTPDTNHGVRSEYTLSSIEPIRYFKLELVQGTVYEVCTWGTDNPVDTVIYLLDADYQLIDEDDDSNLNGLSKLIIVPQETATYYLEVRSYLTNTYGTFDISFIGVA